MSSTPQNEPAAGVISLAEHQRILDSAKAGSAGARDELKKEIEELKKVVQEREEELKKYKASNKDLRKRKRDLQEAFNMQKKAKKSLPKPMNKHEMKWMMRFQQLKAFKDTHGHCNAPQSSGHLGRWVSAQRTEYKLLCEGKKALISPQRIQMLASIGFKWSNVKTPLKTWEERFQQLKQFQKEHNHLRVPQQHPNPPGLGGWVQEQRKVYREVNENSGKVKNVAQAQERIKKLEAIGFEWSVRGRR